MKKMNAYKCINVFCIVKIKKKLNEWKIPLRVMEEYHKGQENCAGNNYR
jgi:hypothetical protein